MTIDRMLVLSIIKLTVTPDRVDLNHYAFEVNICKSSECTVWSLHVIDRSPFGPELSIANNTEYRAKAGELIELPCGMSSVPTYARISWWKNGVEIENLSEKIYHNSLILRLSQASANDSGNYVCRIDDESGGRLTSSMFLKVDRKCD